MASIFRNQPTTLFWRLFVSYFALILIPVIVASLLTNLFVVRLIERDAEKAGSIVMKHFSEETDSTFRSLETDMVNMLSVSQIKSFLKTSSDMLDPTQRLELIHSLMQQLGSLQSHPLVYNAFLYFANDNLVVSSSTYTGKEQFFAEQYPIQPQDLQMFLSHFSDKKTMVFTAPYTVDERPPFTENIIASHSNLTALMSYPFNSSSPDVYLAVNVDRDQIREQLGMQEQWVTDTVLADSSGSILIRNGTSDIASGKIASMLSSIPEQALYKYDGNKVLSYQKSRFHDSWYYVSMIDLETLLKPARLIRVCTIVFVGLFVLIGSFVSYYLSGRLYNPIRDIRSGLESHPIAGDAPNLREGSEFDVIKRFSGMLISRNKELSQMVSGMYPIVHEYFMVKTLFGEYRDGLSIAYYAKEIDFPYDSKAAATVICIEIQYYSQVAAPLSETTKSFIVAELKEKIRRLAPDSIRVCQTRSDRLAAVLFHDPGMQPDPMQMAKAIKQLLQQPHYKASVGIGGTVPSIDRLHASYDHAVAMLKYKSLDAGAEICVEDGAWQERERASGDSFLTVQEVGRIFNRFKAGEYDGLLQSVYDMLDEGIRTNATAGQMKNVCLDVLNAWIRAAESERNDFNISFYSDLFASINRCVTWEELRLAFTDIRAALFRTIEPSDRQLQFAEILSYIHDHYHEELSIEHFAQQMNMSVGHFSRTFKEEVGEKYVEYIAKYRMCRAKQFLLETNMKIDDIAEQVGYWGRNSFIRNFRKYEGTTPAKFRSVHQS
ncbi:helix-turn-helix domain-containing protein [Paenibacillus allorhizosphaerae]|uniref:HTH-type transcriptional activator RhaR n=1 Tax=Paenibacillus allorhizosphaerae TaxID=2849866 RepID=A0ABM8VA30_9BACL|nr:helix-turn-helix domain-containing protein [Paenibacillus allorhizosphaerae]CAG7615252.1 HTH-type transcriptional activator RhaR [Paenibacillus allorhizosphaerae]